MTTVSAVMLVYNEIEFLKISVQSIQKVVDQIIFVDMGSTDGSIYLLESLLRRSDIIVSYPRKDLFRYGFAHARNYGASFCNGDWIFMIDADEIIQEQNLKEFIINSDENKCFDVLRYNYQNPLSLDLSEWISGVDNVPFTEERHRRIYRNLAELHFKGFLHEELYIEGENAYNKSKSINLVLHHLSAYRSGGEPASKQHLYAYMLMHVYKYPGFRVGMNEWYFKNYIPENIDALSQMAAQFARDNNLPLV